MAVSPQHALDPAGGRLSRATAPRFALVSAKERFASLATLDDYENAGADVLKTWEGGAVAVERAPTGWQVHTYCGGWR